MAVLESQIIEAQTYREAAKAKQALELQQIDTQIDQMKTQWNLAREEWENTQIKAPFTGIIIERMVEPGQVVQPGMVLMKIADPIHIKVVAQIAQEDAISIESGARSL
ncbi:efflux RND transporter periplasmic adaptor subunit [Candidatus Peregrinibacteria bacterium]|nr:MAG: efflux RND transporter periplasmic adaptor subunit [Candidatus Peregrinibacteria bacterium]